MKKNKEQDNMTVKLNDETWLDDLINSVVINTSNHAANSLA